MPGAAAPGFFGDLSPRPGVSRDRPRVLIGGLGRAQARVGLALGATESVVPGAVSDSRLSDSESRATSESSTRIGILFQPNARPIQRRAPYRVLMIPLGGGADSPPPTSGPS